MTLQKVAIEALPFVEHYIHLDTVDSTNTYAKTNALLPKQGLTVVHADKQTKGRGQRGNSFFSTTPGGLFASIITPIPDIAQHFSHNRAASLAILDTLSSQSTTASLAIKWPNDIYIGQKKVCGILLESIPPQLHFLVIGFGINLTTSNNDFPEELQHIATSFAIETGISLCAEDVLCSVLNLYIKNLSLSQTECHERYKDHLYRKGDIITINDFQGTLHDVTQDGRLCVKHKEDIHYFLSGTMRFLP